MSTGRKFIGMKPRYLKTCNPKTWSFNFKFSRGRGGGLWNVISEKLQPGVSSLQLFS